MKSITAKLLSVMLALVLMSTAAAMPVQAYELPVPEPVVIELELGTSTADAAYNKNLLTEALNKASEDTLLTVRISSPGTYYVGGSDSGSALRLHSNTVLDLGGATLVRYGGMYNILQNADYDNSRDTGGYDLSHDICVINGTLDGRAKTPEPSNLVNIGHARGVTFRNVSFKNSEGHMLEFSGCKDCVVSGCTFSGYLGSSYSDASEAVQLDICNNEVSGTWNGVYLSDSTVCRDVTVDGCTFYDYPSGVGNHKTLSGNHCKNINITNNRFLNTRSTPNSAIWAYAFDGGRISGNTISGAYAYGISVSAGSMQIEDNTITNATKGGIYITLANSYVPGKSGVTTEEYPYACTVKNNQVSACPAALLFYNSGTVTEMSGNSFTATTDDAVVLSGGATVSSFASNTVTSSGKAGLRVASNSRIVSITGNKISAKGNALSFTSGSSADDISGNTQLSSSADDAVVFTGQTVIKNMQSNTVKSTAKCGIRVANGSKITAISSNSLTSKDNALMVASDSSVTTIGSNTVTSSAGSGIYITGASAGTVNANTVKNCGASGIIVSSSGKVTTVTNNKVSGCKDYGIRINNSSITVKMGSNTVTGNTPDNLKLNCTVIGPDLPMPVLSAATNTALGVKVTWGKVTGAEMYRVYRKTGSAGWAKLADTTAVSYTDKTAKSGTKYTYTVRCITKDGKTTRSGYDATGKSVTYISAPVISSIGNTTAGVKVTWGKVTGAVNYRLYRKTGSGSWAKVGDTTAVSCTDKTVKSGTKYTYTVRCITKDGKSATSSYIAAGKTVTYIAAPVISKLTTAKSAVTITWGKVAGAAKYRVYVKSGSSWKKVADTTSTTYTHKKLKPGTKYTYTVRCITKDGKSATSAYNTTGRSVTCKK